MLSLTNFSVADQSGGLQPPAPGTSHAYHYLTDLPHSGASQQVTSSPTWPRTNLTFEVRPNTAPPGPIDGAAAGAQVRSSGGSVGAAGRRLPPPPATGITRYAVTNESAPRRRHPSRSCILAESFTGTLRRMKYLGSVAAARCRPAPQTAYARRRGLSQGRKRRTAPTHDPIDHLRSQS